MGLTIAACAKDETAKVAIPPGFSGAVVVVTNAGVGQKPSSTLKMQEPGLVLVNGSAGPAFKFVDAISDKEVSVQELYSEISLIRCGCYSRRVYAIGKPRSVKSTEERVEARLNDLREEADICDMVNSVDDCKSP
jgi:hypothetical protein